VAQWLVRHGGSDARSEQSEVLASTLTMSHSAVSSHSLRQALLSHSTHCLRRLCWHVHLTAAHHPHRQARSVSLLLCE
jgi:hypothetical protein